MNENYLDEQYNNINRVKHSLDFIENWKTSSRKTREQLNFKSVFYSKKRNEDESLDIFYTDGNKNKPVFVFIHGGYWKALHKDDFSFLAKNFVDKGFIAVILNYSLCPKVRMNDIARQIQEASIWLYKNIVEYGGDTHKMNLCGHSAGGNLSAFIASLNFNLINPSLPKSIFKNYIGLSGLYNLTPISKTPFLKDLYLDKMEIRNLSPIYRQSPANNCFYALVGADESEEFIKQNDAIKEIWGDKVVLSKNLKGLHHFSIVDAITDTQSELFNIILNIMKAKT